MPNRIPALHRRTKELAKTELKPGTIVSYTTIQHPPAGFGSEPYTVALVELADGKRVCAQLTHESAAPFIGAHVVPCMRRIRTMENGLFVNDMKYEVMQEASLPIIEFKSYVLALTGPSGVGKTTITRSLMGMMRSYCEQAPIYTTRAVKKGDVEPYVHVDEARFDAMVASGEIIAHTQMTSRSELRKYGYRKQDIEAIWAKAKLPVVVTDIHLLQGLSNHLGRRAILSCGLLPPGNSHRRRLSALLHRLRTRGRETAAQIKERLKTATADLTAFETYSDLFDHMVVNDKLDVCLERITRLVKP
ncbi:MAG TPA: OB-fold domain-containing protein [Candidatus Peribacteria bacterium]|nr:OB-fold domain-containing protein [Candidatus Peribacteria bacterium]